jgi:hypothetical protein
MTVRIRFNEVVRCARIVYSESTSSVKDIGSAPLKEKPIVFRARGQILPKTTESVFSKVGKQHEYVSRYQALPEPTILNEWLLDTHMRIYYVDNTNLFRTSPIDTIEGIVITTKSGSVYHLGKMDMLVQKKMDDLCIDPDDPLHCENIPFLVNASYDLYKDILE